MTENAADNCLRYLLRHIVAGALVGQRQQHCDTGLTHPTWRHLIKLVFELDRHQQVPGDFLGLLRGQFVRDAHRQVFEGRKPHGALLAAEVGESPRLISLFFLIRLRTSGRASSLGHALRGASSRMGRGTARRRTMLNLQGEVAHGLPEVVAMTR